jgi:VanZ family protein
LKVLFSSLFTRLARHSGAAWALWCVYAGLIFYLSSQELGPDLGLLPPGVDKVLHMIEYGVFGLLTYHALGVGGWFRQRRRLHLVLAIVIGITYGVSDEVHQSFVPTRESDVRDVMADTAGAAIGAWSLARVRRYQMMLNRSESNQSIEK